MSQTGLWGSGEAYERYIGRWSRPVAREFIAWLELPAGLNWLDVGCGIGAVSQHVLAEAAPSSVFAIDQSAAFVAAARSSVRDVRVAFAVADARHVPARNATRDAAVSGLVLNFIPRPQDAVRECIRTVRPGGLAAAYVWDYAGGMQMLRLMWDAAVALDPAAATHDEAARSSICNPQALSELFFRAGGRDVAVRAIDIETAFTDFDDYWQPFLGGHAPAPAYVMSLGESRRAALRERIRASLPAADDGSIRLKARAWAVKARV